jgi:hypothetical protein
LMVTLSWFSEKRFSTRRMSHLWSHFCDLHFTINEEI